MLPMELQNAKFIWLPSLVNEVNTYVMTREVVAKAAGKRYIFAVTADSDYALFVGDRLVTGRQYADYPFYKVYDRVDITDALTEGENTLTIVGFCANEDSSTYKKSVPGIAYALWEDGCERFHTSEETKMAVHPCYRSGRVDKVTGQLGFSFEYDGRNPEPVWETPGDACVRHAVSASGGEADLGTGDVRKNRGARFVPGSVRLSEHGRAGAVRIPVDEGAPVF